MNALVKYLLSGTILAGGTVASWKAYDEFAPKTANDWFEWKGLKKVSTEQEYRGIFEENKNYVNSLNINELDSNSATSESAKKIKEWCEDKLNKPLEKNSWDTIVKFCELKFFTVRGFLAKYDTKDFITKDDDWKISLFFLKNSNEWKSKIKQENNLTYEDLKNWCTTTLNKKIEETDKSTRGAANLFCKISAEQTIEKLIQKNKTNWTTISEDTEWQNRFEKWKYTPKIIELLKTHNSQENSDLSSNTEKSIGGPKLKDWCEKGKNKKLSEDIENSYIDHIRVVCSKQET